MIEIEKLPAAFDGGSSVKSYVSPALEVYYGRDNFNLTFSAGEFDRYLRVSCWRGTPEYEDMLPSVQTLCRHAAPAVAVRQPLPEEQLRAVEHALQMSCWALVTPGQFVEELTRKYAEGHRDGGDAARRAVRAALGLGG